MRHFRSIFLLLILTLFFLSACSSIGPDKIHTDRKSYNDIVRETDYQQLLTNIVRLSYVEPTLYLKITNITSSYSLSGNIAATPSWAKVDGGINRSLSITPNVSYSDSPTISYMPVDDAQFVTMLHQPISFDDLVLFFNGGVNDVEVLTRLAFNRVGDLDNGSIATKIAERPDYEDYYHFTHLLISLLKHKQAILDAAAIDGKAGLILHFTRNGVNSPDAKNLKKLLNVPIHSNDIVFMSRNATVVKSNHSSTLVPEYDIAKFNNLVYVQTRSANAMLAFLSHSVQIPENDTKAHLATRFRDSEGRIFDWAPLMRGLMRICSSDSEPQDAFVKTYVNHHWFYISNSDINSKITFTILVRLMTLTSGYGHGFNPQTAPLITVPVGARTAS